MTFKTTLRLLGSVLVLGSILLFLEYQKQARKQTRMQTRRAFHLAREPVTGITLRNDNLTLECVKKDGDWFLNAPIRARANAATLEKLLAQLETVNWEERISAEQRKMRDLTLRDYGLDPPRVRISLDTVRRRETLLLGDLMPLGNGLYARRSGSDTVVTVPLVLQDALPTAVAPLRDRSVFQGTPAKTVRLEIQCQETGFIQLLRQEAGWRIQQPISAWANTERVEQLLEALYQLEVETFHWDIRPPDAVTQAAENGTHEMTAKARIESGGLADDAIALRVTVWAEGDSLGQELLLGKPVPDREHERFAKRGAIEAIYTVSDSMLEMCAVNVNALRDHTVFPVRDADVGNITLKVGETKLVLTRDPNDAAAWRIVEPVQWSADSHEVDVLMERLGTLSVTSFLKPSDVAGADLGLSPPAYTIGVQGMRSPDAENGGGTSASDLLGGGALRIGAWWEDGVSRFASMDGQDDVFALPVDQLEWLGPGTVDPLRYRDRTMLSLKPDNVRRLVVGTSAGEQGVEYDAEAQTWRCIDPGTMVPKSDTIRQLLFAASRVRAVRIETRNPESLERYGLAAPAITVTFGLQGEAGIQKTLLIGSGTNNDCRYAMVRGQDVVFCITASLADLVSQALCMSRESSADGEAVPSASGEGG